MSLSSSFPSSYHPLLLSYFFENSQIANRNSSISLRRRDISSIHSLLPNQARKQAPEAHLSTLSGALLPLKLRNLLSPVTGRQTAPIAIQLLQLPLVPVNLAFIRPIHSDHHIAISHCHQDLPQQIGLPWAEATASIAKVTNSRKLIIRKDPVSAAARLSTTPVIPRRHFIPRVPVLPCPAAPALIPAVALTRVKAFDETDQLADDTPATCLTDPSICSSGTSVQRTAPLTEHARSPTQTPLTR